jgi:hypothetical protein
MTTTTTSGAADLRTAAQAVVDRWDTPLWKDVPATAEYIGRLRAALAAGQAAPATQQDPAGWYVTGCSRLLAEEDAKAEARHIGGTARAIPLYAAPQPSTTAPATQQPEGDVVAYLDVGANGYLDLGLELSEDALQQLPKGRHALVIAGTYGIDGYVAAPQPSPTAQAADSVQEDAARLDWLEGQSQVNIERVRYLGADTSIYEVTPFNSTDYNGETLRKAIDAAMNKGGSA